MDVMIGIDPHKRSHTATMLDRRQRELRQITVRAGSRQLVELLAWANGTRRRTWAVECASGLGYLLAQQLVAAGETVVDVPATLASRVRVLGTGQSTKTDPNDARSVAVAALHAPGVTSQRSSGIVKRVSSLPTSSVAMPPWGTPERGSPRRSRPRRRR